jgi:hypothetical protein
MEIEPPDELETLFTRWGVGYREIIHTALCILELEQGGKCRGFCEDIVQSQRSAGTAYLDFAVDLSKFFPDCPRKMYHVEAYARGGAGGWTVRKLLKQVPDSVWAIGAPIAGRI